ncbi:uncharacterized protein [Arachis hypogaea]|uniref:uncharacterized protein n=1 Tax=Arachis hypogaea TaxID=3818 RepID=UPI003B21C2E2
MGTRIEVLTHLLQKGFPEKYTSWYMHGETIVQPEEELLGHNHTEPVEKPPLHDMLTDVFGINDINYEGDDDEPFASRTDSVPMPSENDTNEDLRRITELLKDGNRKLYPGCAKYTKLSFVVELYHIKVLCGATDKTFSMIVDLLNNAFSHANLPTSFYEAKKMIKLLGLGYEKIHACPNNCVDVYDSVDGNNFHMHAALFWTISDFPGLDNLSGWNTHTSLACPSCNFDTVSRRLKFGMKYCFMGHRRWLPDDHEYRHNKHSFDGHTELRGPPPTLSGRRILSQIESSRKRPQDALNDEKNVYDNVLFTILDDKQRTKDNLQARKDLQLMGIREQLHPYPNSSKYPASCFRMKNVDKDIFLGVLKSVSFPDGYSSNISRCVDIKNEREVSGKSLSLENLERLQQRIVLTLCHMEMIFPPTFFTIMVHLVIHLEEEAMIAGPVQYRWMYPVERALGHLKSYVRNKAAPEGCIAEGYIIEECLTFCSRYLEDGNIETRFNRPRRNDDQNENTSSSCSTVLSKIFPALGISRGAHKICSLTPTEKLQAHRYVLTNCSLVDKFREKCRCEIARIYRGRKNATKLVEEYIHAKFHEWFRDYVAKNNDPDITPEIKWLAEGPNDIVKRFEEFNVHGFKFRTMKKDQGLKTQNCGVVMSAITNSVSNGRNPIIVASDNTYYGKVVDMIELDYFGKLRIVLFKCIWVDTTLNKGIKIDQFGITSVNFSNLIHTGDNETDEPFILATDARMVYYVDDPVDEGWCSVCHMKPRDLYDMGDLNEEELDESLVEDIPFCEQQVENLKEFQLTRDEIDEADQDEMHVDENDDNDCNDDDEIDNLDNI